LGRLARARLRGDCDEQDQTGSRHRACGASGESGSIPGSRAGFFFGVAACAEPLPGPDGSAARGGGDAVVSAGATGCGGGGSGVGSTVIGGATTSGWNAGCGADRGGAS